MTPILNETQSEEAIGESDSKPIGAFLDTSQPNKDHEMMEVDLHENLSDQQYDD